MPGKARWARYRSLVWILCLVGCAGRTGPAAFEDAPAAASQDAGAAQLPVGAFGDCACGLWTGGSNDFLNETGFAPTADASLTLTAGNSIGAAYPTADQDLASFVPTGDPFDGRGPCGTYPTRAVLS